MKTLSEGLQKVFSSRLEKLIHYMKKNRFASICTGLLITLIIQSSSAATVIAVTFVNAGIISLTQGCGLIFGANVGTTITSWIIALYQNIKSQTVFNILPIAIFGIGWFFTTIKKKDILKSIGSSLMGLGFAFLGIILLNECIYINNSNPDSFIPAILQNGPFMSAGFLTVCLGLFAGITLTIILRLSSTVIAMLMVLNSTGIIPFNFCAAVIAGANIGSTIYAVIASVGAKVNARRAAWIHVTFNLAGGLLILCFYRPILMFLNFCIPDNPGFKIALFHTIFNLIPSVIFAPLTNKVAEFSKKIIRPHSGEVPAVYKIENPITAFSENTPAIILQTQNEAVSMCNIVLKMMQTLHQEFTNRNRKFFTDELDDFKSQEDYLDSMKEELTNYLSQTFRNSSGGSQADQIRDLLHCIDELESTSDYILGASMILKKCVKKEIEFEVDDLERLDPYLWILVTFIEFTQSHLNKKLADEDISQIKQLQAQNTLFKKNLIKTARGRLENGSNVKTELLYIDLVRSLSKIGDHIYNSFNL